MGKTTVALKIVNRFSSQKIMDQFEKEMSIMSQVCHHNIVEIYGILREGIQKVMKVVFYISIFLYRTILPSIGDGIFIIWRLENIPQCMLRHPYHKYI